MLRQAFIVGAATTAALLLFCALRRNGQKGTRSFSKQQPKLEQKGPEGRRVEQFTLDLTKGTPKLFNNRLCPFGNRAWWAAVEKKVEFEYIHVDLGDDMPASYSVINPYETVPCFYDNGKGVFESINVAEFFEERYPKQGTHLMPSDPFERAKVREVISKFDVGYFYDFLRNQNLAERETYVKRTTEELEWFANLYSKQHPTGPYYLGEQLSLVEIAVLPFLERFEVVLRHYRNFELLPASNPKLARLRLALETARSRPAWKVCAQSAEFFINGYAKYGNKTDAELARG